MSNNRRYFIIIGVLTVLLGVYFSGVGNNSDTGNVPQQIAAATVTINGSSFLARIADTPRKRIRGLSGIEMLRNDEGMLFVFEKSGIYSFWMKGMRFPIDIIWISEDGKVVHIKENASPESYPELFTPPVPARYVLEVSAGSVEKNNIKIGNSVLVEW